MMHRLAARPAAPAPPRAPHRRVAARGILDSYRREQGLAPPEAAEPVDATATDGGCQVAGWDSACAVGCVGEIETPGDLAEVLAGAGDGALVIVDYYRTACGACRYVARAFEKLCKESGLPDGAPHPRVVFLKHNVLDDEDGRTELADAEGIRAVPTFALYRGGERVKTLSTRDRAAVAAAINEASGFEWLH